MSAPESVPGVGRASVEVGDWRITALSDGWMRLDGGAMWGVVPKVLWERMTPAAEDNTIRIGLRPFLAERDGVKVVIEGGVGCRWEDKWRSIYGIEQPPTLEGSLDELGIAPEEITHVVVSHTHFDHVGALVQARDGALVPLFPRARHWAPAAEIRVAQDPDALRRASYRAEDVVPLLECGLLEGYEGPEEILPGLRVHPVGGHSDAVSLITLNQERPGDTAIFWADVVPTTHHIQPAYIMAYDIDQERSFRVRSEWLARAAGEGWIGLFYHDDHHAFGRLEASGRRYRFLPLADGGAGT